MRLRTLLVLALLVVALGSFIWFVERDLPSTDERAELEKSIFPVEEEDVRKLVIRRNGEQIVLAAGDEPDEDGETRVDREWQLVEPLATRADRGAVDSLLKSLLALGKNRVLEDADRGQVGLEMPRAEVTLESDEGAWTLAVGSEVPASTNVVAAVNVDEIVVTSGAFWSAIDKEAGDWRAKEVFSFAAHEIASVTLNSPEPGWTIAESAESGEIRVTGPYEDSADKDAVQELHSALAELKVDEFLDEVEDPAALGLDPAPYRLEIESKNGDLHLFEFAPSDTGPINARADGQLFTVQSELGELLDREPESWRSRAWSGLETWDVERIEVQSIEGDALVLDKRDGDWHRDEQSLTYSVVSDLLYAIADLRAESLQPADGGDGQIADSAQLTLRLSSAEGATETLRLFAAGEGYRAAREDRAVVLGIVRDQGDDLLAKVAALKIELDTVEENAEPAASE